MYVYVCVICVCVYMIYLRLYILKISPAELTPRLNHGGEGGGGRGVVEGGGWGRADFNYSFFFSKEKGLKGHPCQPSPAPYMDRLRGLLFL